MSRLPQKFQAGVTKIQGWVERVRRKKAEAEERKLQAGAEEEPQPSQLQRRHSHSGRFMGFEPAASARLPDRASHTNDAGRSATPLRLSLIHI